jgi:signal transduction histidine kinase
MPIEEDATHSERKQTDESLRVEREKADDVFDGRLAHIDETADAVISRARARADRVLAAARAKMDRQSARPVATNVETERARADEALRVERADADETVRRERAEQVARLSVERQETDKDLSSERARSDSSLATRDEFLGLVSHDLRSMLNTVVGFAQLVETTVSRENHVEQVLSYARRIQRSGSRMDRLIGDLVDVASIEAGRLAVTLEACDPTQVVIEVVETFQAQAVASGISLSAEILPPLPETALDPARILQVLTNLLSNAIKFTPARGSVVVRLERDADDIHYSVSDTGVGIPSDKLEAVFERFLQVVENDRRGLGLGLYISKSIVLGHGGRIWAESAAGKGATFHFTLPIGAQDGTANSRC